MTRIRAIDQLTFPESEKKKLPEAPEKKTQTRLVATALSVGRPRREAIAGTRRKPPPTPIIPERKPATTPRKMGSKMWTSVFVWEREIFGPLLNMSKKKVKGDFLFAPSFG